LKELIHGKKEDKKGMKLKEREEEKGKEKEKEERRVEVREEYHEAFMALLRESKLYSKNGTYLLLLRNF